MTYRISKEFAFSSAHQLHGLRDGHPCGRVHGHNYIVRVTLIGDELDQNGFLLDYNDLKPFGQWLDDNLDHKNLNDVLSFQPTAENMAKHLSTVAESMLNLPHGCRVSVAVSETPKTWASWNE